MGKIKYDGIVILSEPVSIINDNNEKISIYGIFYEKSETHHEELFSWTMRQYITYLYSNQLVQTNNGTISPESWTTAEGDTIPLTDDVKDYVYKIKEKEIPEYRFVENESPFVINSGEAEDDWLISSSFLVRYGNFNYTQNNKCLI